MSLVQTGGEERGRTQAGYKCHIAVPGWSRTPTGYAAYTLDRLFNQRMTRKVVMETAIITAATGAE